MNKHISIIIVALGCAAAANANLVSNGGFEAYTGPSLSGPDYVKLNPGDTYLTDWTIVGDPYVSVDIVQSPSYPPASGMYAVDLTGTPGPGAISQSLTTAAGSYEISFDGRYTNQDINKKVYVTFGSTTQEFDVTSSSSYGHYSFIASTNSASTLLTLADDLQTAGENGNTFVDNVSVQAVPEPAPFAMLGLGLLGFVRRRSSK